jgi:phage tail-like protein
MSATTPYWLLDDVCGWRGETTGFSVAGGGRDLTVDALPGLAADLPKELKGAVQHPIALCAGPSDTDLYVLEEAGNVIRLLNLSGYPRAQTLPGMGGRGSAVRKFNSPRGLATLSDGSIAVSDTKNNRVQIFTPFPHALTAVWTGGFKRPSGIAVGACDVIYVADRGNRRVVKVNRNGAELEEISGLQSPSVISLASDGTLAIVDGEILLVRTPQRRMCCAQTIPNLTCAAFDSDGWLYAGTSEGLIYKFSCDTDDVLRQLGISVLGRDGGINALCALSKIGLVAIVSVPCQRPVLCTIPVAGSYAAQGTFLTGGLDSGIEQCSWHRIQVNGSLPQGTSITVETQTAATDAWPDDRFSTPLTLACTTTDCTSQSNDCLAQSPPGRYLRLRLTAKTNGKASPAIHSIKVFYPRQSYLQYLPAVYQEDSESRDFLNRFLSIFQTSFDAFDDQTDRISQLFDPASVPRRWFGWLAAWLALPINPLWKDSERRRVLKNAMKAYQKRGTAAGLEQIILDYTQVQASIVEHFRLRRLTILSTTNRNLLGSGLRLWSRDMYGRLQIETYSRLGYFRLTGEPEPGIEPLAWGANEFTVLFPSDPYRVNDIRKAVIQVVEREKPAHTKANYCPIYPRFRVGVQSTLGVDARVGEISHVVLTKLGTLGYDSILACSQVNARFRAMGVTMPPQTGTSSRLL